MRDICRLHRDRKKLGIFHDSKRKERKSQSSQENYCLFLSRAREAESSSSSNTLINKKEGRRKEKRRKGSMK